MIVPLAIALVRQRVVYALGVYPLSQRVANIEQRDRTAEAQLLAAQREHEQAAGTLTGKDRAATELATLLQRRAAVGSRRRPAADAPAAGAAGARVEPEVPSRARFEPVAERNRTLTQLKIEMVALGQLRRHARLHPQLETAPEFVVIDNVELGEGADGGTAERDAASVHLLPRRGCPRDESP